MGLRTTFLWTMIGSLALAAAMGIVAILIDLGETGERALVTSLLVGIFSLLCLACAVVLGRRRFVGVMWVGIGAALAALGTWLFCVWFWDIVTRSEEIYFKIGATFSVISVWAPHLGMLAMLRLDRQPGSGLRVATTVVAGLLAAVLLAVWWTEEFEEWTGKIVGVLSILVSCGTVVVPVLALIERIKRRDDPVSIARRVVVTLICPRCQSSEQVPVGHTTCSSCGLRISLDVEEPRCLCGYALYQLTGDRCPECGRQIAERDRWAARAAATPIEGSTGATTQETG